MNILISCSGRRNDLVSYFRALPDVDEVHCGDFDRHAPSFEQADYGHLTPSFNDPCYVERLLNICGKYRIGLLFSLNDFELPILARHRHALNAIGTTVVVSDPDIIDICMDKRRATRFFIDNDFNVPASYSEHADLPDSAFPVIIKPRFGTASIGVEIADNAAEYATVLAYCRLQVSRSAIVQHFTEGNDLLVEQKIVGVEYAIDVVNDLSGTFVGAVVKRKLAKRHGDASLVVTEKVPALDAWARRLSARLGHIGNLDCDVLMDGETIYCVDLNPRFGGAYPFSHLAGVDVPALILKWARGENTPGDFDYEPGIIVTRTESHLRLEKYKSILRCD